MDASQTCVALFALLRLDGLWVNLISFVSIVKVNRGPNLEGKKTYCLESWKGFFFWQVDVPSCFVGLVLENCQLPYANNGHVILANPSPILFYPISSTEVRCLVDVPGQKVPSISNGEMTNYLKTVVAPQVLSIFNFYLFNLNNHFYYLPVI